MNTYICNIYGLVCLREEETTVGGSKAAGCAALLTKCSIKSLHTIVSALFYGFIHLNMLEFQVFLLVSKSRF